MCMFLSCCESVVAECDSVGISMSTLVIVTLNMSVGLFACIRTCFS